MEKHGSLVVGAGDAGSKVFELDQEEAATLSNDEHMVFRWKFDVAPADLSVVFSLLKGICDSPDKQSRADYIIQNRYVTCKWNVRVLLVYVWCACTEWCIPVTILTEQSLEEPRARRKLRLTLKMPVHYFGRMQVHGCVQEQSSIQSM